MCCCSRIGILHRWCHLRICFIFYVQFNFFQLNLLSFVFFFFIQSFLGKFYCHKERTSSTVFLPVFHMGLRPQDILGPPLHIMLTVQHILSHKSFVNCLVLYFEGGKTFLLFYSAFTVKWSAGGPPLPTAPQRTISPDSSVPLQRSNKILYSDISCLTACSISVWQSVIQDCWNLSSVLDVAKKECFS